MLPRPVLQFPGPTALVAAVRLDADWRYVEVNPDAAALLGRDDLVGQNVWECFPSLRGTLLGTGMESAMQTGTTFRIRTPAPAPYDGQDVLATLHPDRRGDGGLVIQFRYAPAGDRRSASGGYGVWATAASLLA